MALPVKTHQTTSLSVKSTFILWNFHVCKWKNAYIKDLNALRIFYVLGKKAGGGGSRVHCACICIGTHSQPLLTEPLNGCLRNLVGMKCSWPGSCIKIFWPYLPKDGSRTRQNRSQGVGVPLLQKTSSSDRKATATNRIHSNEFCKGFRSDSLFKDFDAHTQSVYWLWIFIPCSIYETYCVFYIPSLKALGYWNTQLKLCINTCWNKKLLKAVKGLIAKQITKLLRKS